MSQQGILTDATTAAQDIEFLTGDAGGPVPPTAGGNVDILGGTGSVSVVGTPGSNLLTINHPGGVSKYIVDFNGGTPYATIQSAITAANTAGENAEIWVRPGTYAEALTLSREVYIRAIKEGVIISGSITPTAANNLTIHGCTLTAAVNFINTATAGSGELNFDNCDFQITNGYLLSVVNWTGDINISDCITSSTTDGVVNNTTGSSDVVIRNSSIGAGTANASLIAGNLETLNSRIDCPITMQSSSVLTANNSNFFGALTFSNSSSGKIYNCNLTNADVSTLVQSSTGDIRLSDVTIDCDAASITGAGAGVVHIGSVTFVSDNTIAGTITLGGDELKTGLLAVDPGASGDSAVQFNIANTGEFRIGVDDDAADAFKISQGSALGTNDTFIMTAAGERTMPLNPCFSAFRDATLNNVTGDGTVVNPVPFNAEVFDQGADYNTGTSIFTAPVTGRYQFSTQIYGTGIGVANTSTSINLITSNRSYVSAVYNPGAMIATTVVSTSESWIADMDAGDTAQISWVVGGVALIVNLGGGASTHFSSFYGCLIS
jgi:hypothetical protein